PQPRVNRGREVSIGGRQDPAFGPVIVFGLGGIFVEALKDVVWRVAPINREGARQMMRDIRGHKILDGLRGEPACDSAFIETLLVRLSRMLVDFPVIKEIDVNPVMVFPEGQGASAIDARVIINNNDNKALALPFHMG
ncbi:MAG: acetate--CoA ligase family protein, partial [Deltaproteobacteria bacterium]|nr:acetate--CoA ligase family protein [Deltaproteobacteria bacterium]